MPTTPLNDTAPRIQYEANAGQTEFTFPFWITAENDLAVYVASTLKELTTDYNVSGILNTNGGTVTFNTGLNTGDIVTIERAMPFERASEFQEAGTFKASVLNLELSKMVAMMQQIKGDINRKLGLSTTSLVNAANLVLPDPQDGKALVFDGTGGAMRTSVVNVDDIDSAVIDAQNAATTATSARDTAVQAETNAQSASVTAEDARDAALAATGSVLVSDADTTAGKLSDKIEGGEIINVGGNEKLKLDSGTDTNLLLGNWLRGGAFVSNAPAVAWSPDLEIFCALGNSTSNNNAISPDGVNWTRQTVTDIGGGFSQAIIWVSDLGFFVGIKRESDSTVHNKIFTSPDGLTWTARLSGDFEQYNSVAWSPSLSMFVVFSGSSNFSGTTKNLATSPDGINWTKRLLSGDDKRGNGVVWVEELSLFIGVGNDRTSGTSTPLVMTSSDGINWVFNTITGMPSNIQLLDIVWSPELSLLVAVGEKGLILTSPDGLNWTQVTSSIPSTSILKAVEWSPELGTFCVVVSDNAELKKLYTSTDGATWVSRAINHFNKNLNDVTWSPKLGVFVVTDGNSGVFTNLMLNEGI